MTTSSPNAVPPAGGADPDPDADNGTDTNPMVAEAVEGAVPDERDPETDVDDETDSVEDDRRRSGA